MKKLTEYTKNKYRFTLVERVGDYAVFSGTKEGKPSINWEVIRIRVTPEGSRVISDPNNTVSLPISWEAHERPPSDNEWGRYGWTCINRESALARLHQLTQTFSPPTPSI